MSGVNLQAIYERLNSVPRYHPMSANTYGDWAMEAGDIVTVSREGTGYQSPVGKSTLKWTGKQQIQISTEGSRERNPISKVSAQKYAKSGGGTSGMRGSQELYWEMYSEDGQLHAQISATAQALTSDYSSKITNTNSRIEQTAEHIRTEIVNVDKRLTTQINQTDSSLSMAVGRVKYSSTQTYANKGSFPTTGTAGVLYTAQDTGRSYLYMPGTHSYELAATDEYGNANFLKAGEIAISINESGQTEAKLDATRVLAGKGALTIDDLELPDWMDTTEGLIATKATIVDLNALRARVGTLETDYLKTDSLYSEISSLDTVRVKKLSIGNGGRILFEGNNAIITESNAAGLVSNLKIEQSGNQYTLYKISIGDGTWTAVGSFSRATSLSGAWSSSAGRFIVTASPQGNTYPVKVTYDSNFTPPGGSAIKAIKPSATGWDYLRVWQQVGSLNTSTGIRTIKTFAGSSTVESTDITDYNTGYEKGKSEGGGAGTISIGDILATSYPSGTAASQISNLIASTSEDAVQFQVRCTCGARKTYYIEVP